MKIMFEIIMNVGFAAVVSVALISLMSLVKRMCNNYLRRSLAAE